MLLEETPGVVYALSKPQKERYPSKQKHDTIDLTNDAVGTADELKGVGAEYVFFAAYFQQDSEKGKC